MATFNKHTFVLAAVLSDISDLSDTNFIYILSADKFLSTTSKKEWQNEHFGTNKTPNKITVCLQTNTWVTWLKLVGIEVFLSQKMKALSWEQIVQFLKIWIDPRVLL